MLQGRGTHRPPVSRSEQTPRGAIKVNGDPVIQPVGYQPPTAGRARRTRVTPLQGLLLALAVLAAAVLVFLFTARSVEFRFTPAAHRISLSGAPSFAFGGIQLLLQQRYKLSAEAVGYYPLELSLDIGPERNQSYAFDFVPLPGLVSVATDPTGANLVVDGQPFGQTPLIDLSIAAGKRQFRFTHPRYQPLATEVVVEGRQRPQSVAAELLPNWGNIEFSTEPAGAGVFVDDTDSGVVTNNVVEIPAGEHDVRLTLPGHKSHRRRILVTAREERTMPTVRLQQADGTLLVRTRPGRAGVTVDGQYHGETPVTIALQSGQDYDVQAFKGGFAPRRVRVRLISGEERAVDLDLRELTGRLIVESDPAQARLFVDGRAAGPANQTLELPVRPHRLEIKLDGYAGFSKEIKPRNGLTQELRVKLLTLEEARLAALRPEIVTAQRQRLRLFEPSPITMGASRREPGRRANETLREVALSRLFYIGVKEVTNAQFRAFASGHDSGSYEDQRLDKDDQPVVEVSWHDAALYCNWLSVQDNLPPFYSVEFSKVIGFDPRSTGYRLPAEAEWAWAARHQEGTDELLRFPWGVALPPPARHGNYADRAASHLVGRIIFGYNDNYAVAAPVGTFATNAKGLFDLGGNAAEWTHDFYRHPPTPGSGPLGPDEGEYRVIRGSSWMHGTTTDLRLSFRDYGIDGRRDVGFRIARFAE